MSATTSSVVIPPSPPEQLDPLSDLITTFYELNGNTIDELDEDPSPLEFMRYVSRNTPFVIRKGASEWTAATTWSPGFLDGHLGDQNVNVAVTPKGNADSPTIDHQGSLVFAKPWEEDQPFNQFLNYVIRQETDPSFPIGSEIRYAQTQNDNLRHEYSTLFSHVQKSIPFARIALGKEPEAINMWVGNSHSTTAMHKDNYENIYVQILGQKNFVLMPTLCHPCVNEKSLRPATYVRGPADGQSESSLVLEYDRDPDPVPFATWDPDDPDKNTTPYSHLARPMRVTLDPGDMLYLPAMWQVLILAEFITSSQMPRGSPEVVVANIANSMGYYRYHKVTQSCLSEGICIAVNYW